MGAVLGAEASSSAFHMFVCGRFGNAEVGGDLGVGATERDKAGCFDFALAHAGRGQRVLDALSKRANAGQKTFADQAKIGALEFVEFPAAPDHRHEPETRSASRHGHGKAPTPAIFGGCPQRLPLATRKPRITHDVCELERP